MLTLLLLLTPDDLEYAARLADRGLLDLAEEAFVSACARPELRPRAEFGLALLRSQRARLQRRFDDAESTLRQLLTAVEKEIHDYRAKIVDWTEADGRVLDALEDRRVAVEFDLALTLSESPDPKRVDEAIARLEDLDLIDGKLLLGRIYHRLKFWPPCLASYDHVIALPDRKDPVAAAVLGAMRALYDKKDYRDAASLPDKHALFKRFPALASEDTGRRIFIEVMRAHYALRDIPAARAAAARAVDGTAPRSLYRVLVALATPRTQLSDAAVEEAALGLAALNHYFAAVEMWRALGNPRAWEAIGELHADRHRWHEAAAAFARANSPAAAEGRLRALWRIARKSGDRAEFDAAAARHPDLIPLVCGPTELYAAYDARNLAAVLRAAGKNPSEEATHFIARAYYHFGNDKAKALEAFERHLALAPPDARRLRSIYYVMILAPPDRALKASEKLPAGNSTLLMQILQNRIDLLVNRGEDAASDLAALMTIFDRDKVNPDIAAYALVTVAQARLKAGDKKRAGEYFERALQIRDLDDNADPDTILPYAELFRETGDHARALDLYERVRALSRLDATGKEAVDLRIGESLTALGRWENAIAHYRILTAGDPDKIKHYLWRLLAEAYRGAKRPREAAKIYGSLAAAVWNKKRDAYWPLITAWGECALDANDYTAFYDVMADQLRRTPKWDDGPWAPKLEALLERYNKVGSKPLPPRR